MARNSGIYNVKMAVAIFSGLYPEMAFKEIPSMPVVHGSVAHEQRGLAMAQIVLGMIHAPVSRSELLNHPQGRAKILEEANEMRKSSSLGWKLKGKISSNWMFSRKMPSKKGRQFT